MKIPLTSSHLISMSQIIYMKDPTRTDSKNSSYFLPLNTYPEYNRPIQENILYNTFTYTRFSHWKFSLILYFIQYLRLVLHISPSKRISRTVFSHVAFPCLTSPPFAAPFEPSPFFYFVSLYRPPPSVLWSDGSIVRCPGYNPIRLELDRDNRDGPRVVANGVATIPRTALDRSFIFTDSPRNAIPTPPPLDSLKPATTGLSLGQCGENSLDFSYVHASARGPSIPMQELFRRSLK